MILRAFNKAAAEFRIPRESGDDPYVGINSELLRAYSPRERG